MFACSLLKDHSGKISFFILFHKCVAFRQCVFVGTKNLLLNIDIHKFYKHMVSYQCVLTCTFLKFLSVNISLYRFHKDMVTHQCVFVCVLLKVSSANTNYHKFQCIRMCVCKDFLWENLFPQISQANAFFASVRSYVSF